VFEWLPFLELRRCQYDRRESYLNEAVRFDPANVELLTEHAGNYVYRRRFPEALRKLDQVLDITPGDVGALELKGLIAQAEGDLPHASALLALVHPEATDLSVSEIQVYQAILERRPAG